MKKVAVSAAALLAAAFLTGFFLPWEGPWLDGPVSSLLSRKFHADVQVEGSRVTRWSVLSVGSAHLRGRDGADWAATGPGKIRRSFSRTFITLTDLVLAPKVAGRFVTLSSVLPDGGRGLFEAREIAAVIIHHKEATTVHVSRWVSEAFVLRGGIKLVGGRVVKAHALLVFPRSVLERLPGDVRSRLKARPDGSGEFRLTFSENSFTLAGATGPLLKAQWQPSP